MANIPTSIGPRQHFPGTADVSTYRHPLVRDLDWALSSPSLILRLPAGGQAADVTGDAFWQTMHGGYRQRLRELDADPRPLTDFMARNTNHRLGYYFEYLLAFWLQDGIGHPFRLWRHHLTVYRDRQTLGEMDFLVEHQGTGELEHWEVAVKFYLGAPPLHDIHRWVGPTRSDTLGRKLEHLALQQFRFTEAEGRPIALRRAVVKGRLFHPARDDGRIGRFISPAHLRGLWFTREDFLRDPRTADPGWRPASREEWLTARQDLEPLPLSDREALMFGALHETQLLLGFRHEKDTEPLRCFLARHAPR